MRIKLRIQMFFWYLRNRDFWNRGALHHWFDWFSLARVDNPHLVPWYKRRKYKRWLKSKEAEEYFKPYET